VILASIASTVVASTIAYPHDLLRSRLQDAREMNNQKRHVNVYTMANAVIAKEGVFSLWTGLRIHLLRVVPATCISFSTYEYISKHFYAKA
jgi:hypothetical protein